MQFQRLLITTCVLNLPQEVAVCLQLVPALPAELPSEIQLFSAKEVHFNLLEIFQIKRIDKIMKTSLGISWGHD